MIELQDIKNPVNILQQPKSKMTTNTFVQPVQEVVVTTDNKVPPTALQTFNTSFSTSVIGLLDDLLHKPSSIPWPRYLVTVLNKDNRTTHIGILFLALALLFILIKM
jgi:hypothetical protein